MNWLFLKDWQRADLLTQEIIVICDMIQKHHEQVQFATMVAHRGLAG